MRHEQIDVVRSDKVLRQANDGAHERRFAVVVSRVLADRSGQLSDLHFLLIVTLDAREHDLTLTRLETVDQRRDGALVVQVAEQHQLLVDEIAVIDMHRILLVQVHLGQAQLAPALTFLNRKRRQQLFNA